MKDNKQVASLCPEENLLSAIEFDVEEKEYEIHFDFSCTAFKQLINEVKKLLLKSGFEIRAIKHNSISKSDISIFLDYLKWFGVTQQESSYFNISDEQNFCCIEYDIPTNFFKQINLKNIEKVSELHLKSKRIKGTLKLAQSNPEEIELKIDEFLSEIELDFSDDENMCPVHFNYRCTTINQLIKITNEIKKLSLENEQKNIVSNEFGLVYQFSTYVDIEKWIKYLGGFGIKHLYPVPVPFDLDLSEKNGMEIEYDIHPNYSANVYVKSAEHQLVEQYLAGEIIKGTLKIF